MCEYYSIYTIYSIYYNHITYYIYIICPSGIVVLFQLGSHFIEWAGKIA